MKSTLLVLLAASLGVGLPRSAHACGGGMVTTAVAGIVSDSQRIFISVRAETTEVITQIGIPDTSGDYGVLIPVPAEPTLDAEAVDAVELDELDRSTAPEIRVAVADSGGSGCGCGSVAGGDSKSGSLGGARGDGSVQVSAPVNIGPVTAVTLTGDTGDAVNGWLASSGFVIPAAQQPLVAAYSGPGQYFIAIRRGEPSAPGGATSVGIHFTLPGDQRGLPLRFAALGAAPTVAFTVFVAAGEVVAPSAPFEALTLNDLDADLLRGPGYRSAVADAVGATGGRAFVIESASSPADLPASSRLRSLVDPGKHLTRLTTVLAASELTEDVAFDADYSGDPLYGRRVVLGEEGGGSRHAGIGGAGLLAWAAVGRRRSRRHG